MTLADWILFEPRWTAKANLEEWQQDLRRCIRRTQALALVQPPDPADPTQGSEGPTDLLQARIDDDPLGRMEKNLVSQAFIRQAEAVIDWCQDNLEILDSFKDAFEKQNQAEMDKALAFLDRLMAAYATAHK